MRRILNFFERIQEPRNVRYVKHPFETVLGVGILSIFCDCVGWEQREEFSHHTYDLLQQFFSFPGGIPRHDAFSRVFQKLCPQALCLDV
ncbi:MAG: transposase family protein [Alphaproteobacteria bacterium]